MIGLILAAAFSMPPAGTYTYSMSAGGSKVAQTSVTIVHDPSGTTVSETATVNGANLVSRALFDSDGNERSYDIAAGGAPVASVAIDAQKVTIHAQGTAIPIAVSKTAFTVVDSGLGAAVAMLPALIAQTHANTFTLVPTVRPRAIVFSVSPAPSAVRPAEVPASDTAVALSAEGLTQTMWFNPKTYVLDAFDGPMSYLHVATGPATALTAVPTAAPPSTPPPATFPSRELTFTSKDGSKLAGTISYPREARGRFPMVVLVAGSGTHDRDETIGPNRPLRDIADGLNGAGYAVLRYDKRFAGASTSATSAARLGRQNYVDDVIAATASAAADPRVDASRIFLLGHSEGGELVMGAAIEGARVSGLALLSPLPIPYAQILEDQHERGPLSESQLRSMLAMHFIQTWNGIDPRIEVTKLRVPILVVHGSKDANVTDAELSQLIRAAKESHRRIATAELDDDNHLFARLPAAQKSDGTEYFTSMPFDPRLITVLVQWLNGVPRG